MLSRTGGRRGKLYNDTTEWDYFPEDCLEASSDKEFESYDDIPFMSIKDLINLAHDYANDENKLQDNCAYELVNIRALEASINKRFVCRCTMDKEVEKFVRYCATLEKNHY